MLIAAWLIFNSKTTQTDFTETVKIALRDTGNQLLLNNQDSTSLVLPVMELEPMKYRLSFQEELFIEPDSLVAIADRSLIMYGLPDQYRVEVLKCENDLVSYSYEMNQNIDKDIIPCGGRDLPVSCYIIDVRFINTAAVSESNIKWYYGLLGSGLLLLILGFIKKQSVSALGSPIENYATLGSFQFYPDQNKLVKQATEISLSKKECELLEIFVAHPNQVVKRDELTKKVWEDNGVFVGRSLDTYISKLRKKLQTDTSIKLTNVHGVGYKLEIK